MAIANNAKKLTGKERVYKVTFSYQKRYVNSWDILHRRTPVREEFVNTTASLYVLASTKREVSDILNSDENFVDLKISNIEKQPLFYFTWADDDEGGVGVSFDRDNIPRRHHFYGNEDGNNTLADIVNSIISNADTSYEPITFEDTLEELYDIIEDEISYLNEGI